MPDTLSPALIEPLRGCSLQGVALDSVSVLRLDRLGGAAPGNKSFKLRYNLKQAKAQGFNRIVSFGGGWSNHLHALAALGAELGLATVGLVRGGEAETAMMEDARRWGMQLLPVSREEYHRRHEPGYLQALAKRFDNALLIPEGGANEAGLHGCREIAALAEPQGRGWDKVVVAVGTGTTLAGLAAGLQCSGELVGISALKGALDLPDRVNAMLDRACLAPRLPWRIEHDFHCGGFAKVDPSLREFIPAFESATGIPLDPVYTGKLFFAIYRKLASGQWPGDQALLAVHSGGLQGRRGFPWLR